MTLEFGDDTVRIGYHASIASRNLIDVLFTAVSSKANTLQMYLSSPRSYKPSTVSEEDARLCRRLMNYFPQMSVYVHACLLFNLNGSTHIDTIDKNLSKAKTEKQKEKFIEESKRMKYCENASIEGLIETLDLTANTFGKRSGVVVHIGSGEDKEKAINRIATNLVDVLTRKNKNYDPKNRVVVLENAAGEGNKIGSTLDDIQGILNRVKELDPEKYKQVFVCIDTCHLFAAGDYDISREGEMVRFFEDFSNKIGIEKLKVIHLNDSAKACGCHRDLHDTVGFGYIFGDFSKFDSSHFFFSGRVKGEREAFERDLLNSDRNTNDPLNSFQYLLHQSKNYGIDLILETYDPRFLDSVMDVIYNLSSIKYF